MEDESRRESILDIYRLHNRHALNKELTDVFAAAATVAMQRHHSSPKTWSVTFDEQAEREYSSFR